MLLGAYEPTIKVAAVNPVLVHRDFGTSNVFVRPQGAGWAVTGLFDFEDACAGDPVEDFKWMALEGPESGALSASVEGYLETRGLDEGTRDRLAFYLIEHALDVAAWLIAPELRRHALEVLEDVLGGWRPELGG